MLKQPIWLGVAFVGTTIGLVGVLGAWRMAAGVAAGRVDLLASEGPAALPVLTAVMVLCQTGAHVALLMAGVDAAPGAAGALCLHVLLALAGALAVRRLDRALAALLTVAAERVRRLLALLVRPARAFAPPPALVWAVAPLLMPLFGRAPPAGS